MLNYDNAIKALNNNETLKHIEYIYGIDNAKRESGRYISLVEKHRELFNSGNKLFIVSAPGRIELIGNHTDHNNGKVLTAAINRDSLACVSKRSDNIISIHSKGYEAFKVNLSDLSIKESEYNSTPAIVKGIAYGMQKEGYKIGGFDACIHSTVLSGSGLSSSASIEILLVSIFDALYNNDDMPSVLKAKIGQFAENKYFGKPSGLLDQSASAIGGLVYIDFEEKDPKISPISMDFDKYGYKIIVVNTNSSHDNLTSAYASIPKEMKTIAGYFNQETLRKVSIDEVFENIANLQKQFGERAILRALHFYNENNRVDNIISAIKHNDIQSILNIIIDSGRSSFMYLQNIYFNENYQPMSLALALSEQILSGKGAWRIHGGGFAGTTLNIVPNELSKKFVESMERVFGKNACFELNIRPIGPSVIKL